MQERLAEQIAEYTLVQNLVRNIEEMELSLSSTVTGNALGQVVHSFGFPESAVPLFTTFHPDVFKEIDDFFSCDQYLGRTLLQKAADLLVYKSRKNIIEATSRESQQNLQYPINQYLMAIWLTFRYDVPNISKRPDIVHVATTSTPLSAEQNTLCVLADRYRDIKVADHIVGNHTRLLSKSGSEFPLVARTPLTASQFLSGVYYKREDLTAIGAYKVRGALVALHQAMKTHSGYSFAFVSTGNHALGGLKAAEVLNPHPASIRIVIPRKTDELKLRKLQEEIKRLFSLGINAKLEMQGETFDEAKDWLKDNLQQEEYYIDPYTDRWVVAGQGTIGLEILAHINLLLSSRNFKEANIREIIVITPIGGGGLLSGICSAVNGALQEGKLQECLLRGAEIKFVGLRIPKEKQQESKYGGAILVKNIAISNQIILNALGVDVVEIEDSGMEDAMKYINSDIGVKVEGPSAATIYPVLYRDEYAPREDRLIICVLSGGNVSHFPV